MNFILLLISLVLFATAVYLFVLFIVKRDRGHREPLSALFAAVGFGLLAVLAAGELNNLLLPREVVEGVAEGDVSLSARAMLIASLTIGLIEESLKCIPLALFIYRKKYFDELTDGVIYFGLAALTFGVIEDILYAGEFGGGVGIFRIITAPYLHAGFTVLFGITLAYRKVLGISWLWVLGGYLAAIVTHGMFDFAAFSGSGWGIAAVLLISLVLNITLFVLFRRAQKHDERRGQSTVGINKFCRHCGRPNPKQLLHCSYCGKLS